MTFRSPIGSSVYFVLVFINFPSFSPVACAINANNVTPVCKPDGQNAFADVSYAVITILFGAMGSVFCDDTVGIKKSLLCRQKRNAVFGFVFLILFLIPFKGCSFHQYTIPILRIHSNTKVWKYIWLIGASVLLFPGVTAIPFSN